MANREINELGEWQRSWGFTLHTEVGRRLLDSIDASTSALKVTKYDFGNIPYVLTDPDVAGTSPSVDGIYAVSRKLSNEVRAIKPSAKTSNAHDKRFYKKYGVSQEDLDRSEGHVFSSGFNDLNFTWHFAPAVANAALDVFVDNKVIAQEEKNRLTLTDWSGIIGSGWFSKVIHDFALTDGGLWRTFGLDYAHFDKGAINNRLALAKVIPDETAEPLRYKESVDREDELTYATVEASREVVRGLRGRMIDVTGDGFSAGCPVARKSVKLSAEQAASDPHFQSLIDTKTMTIVPERSDAGHVRAVQDHTIIDKTLAFYALQLDNYDSKHGTPAIAWNRGRPKVVHRKIEPLNALSWPIKAA